MSIILYSQPNCPQCKMVHMLLNKNKIEYEECQDVELMKSKGIQHTPTLEVEVPAVDEQGNQITETKFLKAKELIDFIKLAAQ